MTAADDTMMKAFNMTSEGAIAENGEPLDLEAEIYTISSNQVDSVAVGGDDKKAYVYRVEEKDDGTLRLASDGDKELAMCFDSPVMKLEYHPGGKLLGVSQDSHVQILDTETSKVTSYSKSAHEGSVRNAAIDPHLEFLSTTGCDGMLKITKIA